MGRGLIIAVAALVLAGGGAAAVEAERVIARKATTGGFADVRLSGSAVRPTLVRIRAESAPAQAVQVTWTLRCTKGKTTLIRRGQFRATTPVSRRPLFPMTRPDRCGLGATVQLEREGSLTVTLLAR